MKITPVSSVPAAASPSHPDHARWVKERTLAMEVGQHATFREAETANIRALERLANRKRKPRKPKQPRSRNRPSQHLVDHGKWTGERLFDGTDDRIYAQHGVTVRQAPKRKAPKMPPCKLCRVCVWCRRAIRVSMIGIKAREQDLVAMSLQNELTAIMFAALGRKDYKDALGRELPFSRLIGHDVDRAVTQGIEWVCDRSTSFMGQWR